MRVSTRLKTNFIISLTIDTMSGVRGGRRSDDRNRYGDPQEADRPDGSLNGV